MRVDMQRPSDKLFTRPRFALDKHRDVRRRDLFDDPHNVNHLLALTNDALEAEVLVQGPTQQEIIPNQLGPLQRAGSRLAKVLNIDRFVQIVISTVAQGLTTTGHGRMSGDQNHFRSRRMLLGSLQHGQAVDIRTQNQVGDDQVKGLIGQQIDGFEPLADHRAAIA